MLVQTQNHLKLKKWVTSLHFKASAIFRTIEELCIVVLDLIQTFEIKALVRD